MARPSSEGQLGPALRPPLKWHGGKGPVCRRILQHFPAHKIYLEPFGGAASVLLNKKPCEVEIYNDLDGRLTNFFEVLRNQQAELLRRLQLTPYSEIEFARAAKPSEDLIEQARRDFVRWRMSMGGRGKDFSYTVNRSRRGMADVVSAYQSAIEEVLPRVAERFRRVQIVQQPATELIARHGAPPKRGKKTDQTYDASETLIYADPPYVPATRNRRCRKVYQYEMSEEAHRELAAVLCASPCMVMLSGYPSQLYDELYAGWHKVTMDVPNHAAGGRTKQRKQETLWLNSEAWRASPLGLGHAEGTV